ncbi:MAG: hypothetical protein ACPL28_11045, partial [bacterium]
MVRQFIGLFLILLGQGFATLVPTPLINSPHPIQRFNWSEAYEHLRGNLFDQCWGISKAKIRNQSLETWLIAVTDDVRDRIVFFKGVDSLGHRYAHWIKKFGKAGSGVGRFQHPRGIGIDTTIYTNQPENYFIYIADRDNNRIVRLYYNALQESTYFYDANIGVGLLDNPEDVECISINGTSAYLVITDSKHHRILIYKIAPDLTPYYICAYGALGNGIGEFREPSSACIVPCSDSLGIYRIYVVDPGNYRLVSLIFDSNTNAVFWERSYTDETKWSYFHSITSNPYYCVYITDRFQHRIWVFTQGLTELLYIYKPDEEVFESPIDLCIYQDEIAVTEMWTPTTGLQYFKIIPEIREFYPEPNIFDATEDSVKINFRVDETAHYLTMELAGRNLFENQYYVPGHYSVYWDGRDTAGKVVLPGNYTIRIWCQGQVIATTGVVVKGTLKSGTLATNEHWTEEGEPYVLTGDVQVPGGGRLIIDPGVKV